MKKPSFSCILIARDEEKTLPRLLRSLEEFKSRGGEVCILDTGSKDATVKIARDWGCVVKEVGTKYVHTIDAEYAKRINERFVVEGEAPVVKEGDKYFDFASARNEAAGMASNNWCSFADADECFTALDIDKINAVIDNKDLENLEYEFIFSHDQWGNPQIQFVQSKFYRKDRLKWFHIVHENLFPI